MDIKTLTVRLAWLKGKRDTVQNSLNRHKQSLRKHSGKLRQVDRALKIVKEVGLQTQSQIAYNISSITTLALEAVLTNPYSLEVDFVERRNKTECDLTLGRGDINIDPFDAGGGAVDVAAVALRVASWSMQFPRSRNVLILDEPFKHLKGEEANVKMLQMVREVSAKLGIQIIMVSDERVSREETLENTDRLFEVSINKGKSSVSFE